MIKLFLLVLALMAIAFAGFAIQILLKKNGKFSSASVSGIKALKEQNIHCFKTEQKLIDKKLYNCGKGKPEGGCTDCSCH